MRISLLILALVLGWPTPERQAVVPGAVTDLAAVAATDSAIVLQWTEAPSGNTSPARYLVRYGPFESFLWSTAADVTTGGCAAPVYGSTAGGGRTRACVLKGLSPERMYHFQLVAYTGVLNSTLNPAVFGDLSNVAEAATARRVGSMVIQKPPMTLEPLAGVWAMSAPGIGSVTLLGTATIYTGHYTVLFTDSLGAKIAVGELLVARP